MFEDYKQLWGALSEPDREVLSKSFRNFVFGQFLGFYIGGGIGYQLGK